MMPMHTSSKIFDGYSTVFRQWRAEETHCKFLHGYAVSFKVHFEGKLDKNNWVWDFGGMKRAKHQIEGKNPKEWMDFMFDHTTIIAIDDPEFEAFSELDRKGVIQLRILQATGAEKFAEYVFYKIDEFVRAETNDRVRVTHVDFMENYKNTASYYGAI